MNLTPEYPPEVKPERVGVYKTRMEGCETPGYSLWDGRRWSCEADTVDGAQESPEWHRAFQNKHWQGLAEDPGKRADLVARMTACVEGPLYMYSVRGLLREAIEALKETT